jgi:hypothetical protein
MRSLTVGVAVLVCIALVSAGWAGEPPTPKEVAKSPDALKDEIEGLRPAKLAWREIQWKTWLLEGLKEAREKKKPILLWVVGPGEALDGRC